MLLNSLAMKKFCVQVMFLLVLISFNGINAQLVDSVSLFSEEKSIIGDGLSESYIDSGFILKSESLIPPSLVNLVINEINTDSEGGDNQDFIELYDGGVGNTPLDEICVVFFNGTDPVKSYYSKILKDCKTNGEGYFVFGNSNVANVGLTFPDSKLQNGPDAVVIYYCTPSTSYPTGTPLAFDNLIDGVVYVTNTNDVASNELLSLLKAGQSQVNEEMSGSSEMHSLQRFPNGSGGVRNTSSFIALSPTPGKPNNSIIANINNDAYSSDFYFDGDDIVFNPSEMPCFITIADVSGRVVMKAIILERGVMDLSFLKEGLYLVQINDRVKKFLKH
jgi:hypothetical protein